MRAMDIVDPKVETYMASLLARRDEPVLLEMEAEAERDGFPIIGRLVGATVEVLARSAGARRVFELGSGYGYSAYWFARAVGSSGEVHCTEGKFDVVYNDIDKDGYPDAWRAARERIRVGGLYLCDNVLWYGRVTEPEPERADTRAILEHNALIAEDERYLSAIVPTRDGLMVAIRVR